jgi:hypothetical protein
MYRVLVCEPHERNSHPQSHRCEFPPLRGFEWLQIVHAFPLTGLNTRAHAHAYEHHRSGASHESIRNFEDSREIGAMSTIQEGVRDIGIDATASDMYREARVPRVSVGKSVGRALLRSDRGVEQSLQRLVSTLTEQIREKAAAIERLESSKRRGAKQLVCLHVYIYIYMYIHT